MWQVDPNPDQYYTVLPRNMIATKFPGYFWDFKEKVLYSLKVGGVLRPMKVQKPFWLRIHGRSFLIPEGYRVSVRGKRRSLTFHYLWGLRPKVVEIPVERAK